MFKKNIRKAKKSSWEIFCQKVESAKMHKLLAKNPLLGPKSLKINGGYTSNSEEILTCLLTAHFGNGNAMSETSLVPLNISEASVPAANTDIFSVDRIKWAVKSFSPYKSSGIDGILKSLDIIAPLLRVYLIGKPCLGVVISAGNCDDAILPRKRIKTEEHLRTTLHMLEYRSIQETLNHLRLLGWVLPPV